MIWNKLQHILSLATCLLMIMAVSIVRDGRVLGHEVADEGSRSEGKAPVPVERTLDDGMVVINTTTLASDVQGYGGTVPLEVYIRDGHIYKVEALANAETPDLFQSVKEGGLLRRWDGKTLGEAAAMKVDGVSGATFSSSAVIENVRRGIAFAQKEHVVGESAASKLLSVKNLAALTVALLAAILPLFVRNKKYLTLQLALNVAVLGFWRCTTISYAMLLNYMSNGINLAMSAVPVLLLIVAFVYPLFGKKGYYCAYVCPLGSLQQLAGRCTKRKLHMGAKAAKRLDYFRQVLWGVLMLCLWGGVLSGWTDYELFSAFALSSASVWVIVVAAAFVVLSVFVPRPYCRFVCPTGTLLKAAQYSTRNNKNENKKRQ